MENKKCRGVQNEDFLGGKIIHMDSSTISLQYSPQTGRNRSHDNIHHYCPVPYIHYLKLKETQTSQIASQFIRHSIIFFILKIPLSVGILSFRPVRGAQGGSPACLPPVAETAQPQLRGPGIEPWTGAAWVELCRPCLRARLPGRWPGSLPVLSPQAPTPKGTVLGGGRLLGICLPLLPPAPPGALPVLLSP